MQVSYRVVVGGMRKTVSHENSSQRVVREAIVLVKDEEDSFRLSEVVIYVFFII